MYSKEDAIKAVEEIAQKTGSSLSKREYQKLRGENHPEVSTFYRRFEGWNSIKQETSLEVEKKGGKLDAKYDFFESPTTDSQIYWLGFLMGDGCVYENSAGNNVLSLGIKDRKHLEKFKQALNSEHSIVKNDDLWQFRITDKKLTSDLKKCGIKNKKTFSQELPNCLESSSDWSAFVRGLFDADGSIYFGETSLSWYISGYKLRLEKLKDVIPVDLMLYDGGSRNDDTRRLKSNSISDVVEIRNWIYPEYNHTRLERKYEKMQEVGYGVRENYHGG